jgi:hypothetical protein
MPEFVLDRGDANARFAKLDTFTQAYIECLFFTDSSLWAGDGCERQWSADHGGDASLDDLSEDAWRAILEDCADFQKSTRDLLDAVRADHPSFDDSRAGHDFWLTRNGHGAGFWDRGLGKLGDHLSKAAKLYGSVDTYIGDDDLIYHG